MSADGKISDYQRSAARFGSRRDRQHLEQQVAQADAVLLGAETLRAYGSSLSVTDPNLLRQRSHRGQSPQPVQIVCSASGQLDRHWRFFHQALPRWLVTTPTGAQKWSEPEFERVFAAEIPIPWPELWQEFSQLGIRRLSLLGGGELVAGLVTAGLVDDLWLTVCPLLIAGAQSPTPLDGPGFWVTQAPRLELLSCQVVQSEVFLHYQVIKDPALGSGGLQEG
jgi:5-amino-6-(5-phosphoribosylamino)uracil reductase